MKSPFEIIQHDVEQILSAISHLLTELKNQSVFITGGTGFFGQWMLDTLQAANRLYDLNISVTVLTRNLSAFEEQAAYLVHDDHFHFIEGDVRDFAFPGGEFPVIIHAATTRAEETFNKQDALLKYDILNQGTRHVLEFARQAATKRILWTSSGARYGRQPVEMDRLPETYPGCPDPMLYQESALGIGKLSAEYLCAYYGNTCDMEIKIARCFSFVGPRMQMKIHYAIGNFITDVVNGRDIAIRGDGQARRSYMYITDLVIWLFTILLKGKALYPYNVGSSEMIRIADLARLVAQRGGESSEVMILNARKSDGLSDSYLPDITRAMDELGLKCLTSLPESISKTIAYERACRQLPAPDIG